MKLRNWLSDNKIAVAEFARRIGVRRSAVYRYLDGDRIPKRDAMRRIVAATQGAVRPDDFLDAGSEADAVNEVQRAA